MTAQTVERIVGGGVRGIRENRTGHGQNGVPQNSYAELPHLIVAACGDMA